jgi:hypothetical protein
VLIKSGQTWSGSRSLTIKSEFLVYLPHEGEHQILALEIEVQHKDCFSVDFGEALIITGVVVNSKFPVN